MVILYSNLELNSIQWESLSISSLQSLNEGLASGSKEEGKVALEKQVETTTHWHGTACKYGTQLPSVPLTLFCVYVQVQEVNAQLQKEKDAEVQARQAVRTAVQASGGGGGGGKGWNEEELPLLIKAVNLFPAGTNARYPPRAAFNRAQC